MPCLSTLARMRMRRLAPKETKLVLDHLRKRLAQLFGQPQQLCALLKSGRPCEEHFKEAVAQLGVHVDLDNACQHRLADVVARNAGGAVERQRHRYGSPDPVKAFPVEAWWLPVSPMDVPDGDGEAGGSGVANIGLGLCWVSECSASHGSGDFLVSRDAPELGLHAGAVWLGQLDRGADKGGVLV